MKKSLFLTMVVFAITLSSSQLASGQGWGWVVCNNDQSWERWVGITAPYFSADLQAKIEVPEGWAFSTVESDDIVVSKWCPGNCGFKNIGKRYSGITTVYINCESSGSGSYAKAEAWGIW